MTLSWERWSFDHTGQSWDNLERKILPLVIWLLIVGASTSKKKKNTINRSIFRIFISQEKVYCDSQDHSPDSKLWLLGNPQSHKEHETSDTSACWKSLAGETGVSRQEELEQELAQTINYGSLPKAFDMYILPFSALQPMVPTPIYPDLTL